MTIFPQPEQHTDRPERRNRRGLRLVAGAAATAVAGGFLITVAPSLSQPAQALPPQPCYDCEPHEPPTTRATTTTTTAPPNTPPTASFTWTRNHRAAGGNATSDLTSLGNYVAQPLLVYLNACNARAGSNPITSYQWLVNGSVFMTGCSQIWSLNTQGTYALSLKVTDSVGLSSTTTQNVVVRDRWIVTLGDSIASGEGNPVVPQVKDFWGNITTPVQWPNTRCHRSTVSASQQAAIAWENAHPQESVTFVNLGCSGAKILNVLQARYGGQSYAGIQPDGINEPPQLDQLETLKARSGRVPDMVYLSAGANDFGFADIAGQCAHLSSMWSSTPQCAQLDPTVKAGDNLLVGNRSSYTTPPPAFSTGRYAQLASALGAAGVANNKVAVSQYPDPTKKDDGTWCDNILGDTPLGLGRINNVDVRWAGAAVTGPVSVLNDDVAFAAAQNGWALVPGIVSDFQTHGYCANAHWIVNYSESPNTQNDQNGTLHPNTNGTADYAVRIRQGATASGILPA